MTIAREARTDSGMAISVSVCLSVCLFVCLMYALKSSEPVSQTVHDYQRIADGWERGSCRRVQNM